ncbi:MAG: class I SAM-dependent methyltransferase [Acidobacteriota bacterium]|jgi:SAM-dependent methyltransferase
MVQEHASMTVSLNQFADHDRYNGWIYEEIEQVLGRRVLEVGSGTGNITRFLAQEDRQVVATDGLPAYREHLGRLYEANPRIEVGEFDLNRAAPPEYVERQFDSVVCLNVLEHIEDDLGALREMRRVIRPGGYLALLVPAHQVLYGKFDEAVGHFRRYSKDPLLKLLKQADFEVTSIKFFNITAVIPWLVNGRIFKRDYLPEDQTRLVNLLVPVLKLERLIGPPCGLSLIALAKKTERSES